MALLPCPVLNFPSLRRPSRGFRFARRMCCKHARDHESTIGAPRAVVRKSLRRDAEDGVDEVALADRISLADPADLAFANHMHRFVTCNRSARGVH